MQAKGLPTSADTARTRRVTVAATIALCAAVGVLVNRFDPTDYQQVVGVVAMVGCVGLVVGVVRSRSLVGGMFHPLAGPLAYIAFVEMAPIAFVSLTNQPVGLLDPRDVTARAVGALALTAAGFAIGARIGLVAVGSPRPRRGRIADPAALRSMGTVLLVAVTATRLAEAVLYRGRAYGEGQTAFGTGSSVTTAVNGLILVAVVLLAIGNRPRRRVLSGAETVLALAFAAATLAMGFRGILIAPAIFLAYARHRWVRPLPAIPVAIAAFAALFVFQAVGETRNTAGDASFVPGSWAELARRTTRSMASPALIMDTVVREVPVHEPYHHGSTYLAALQRQLPGPLARAAFGYPRDTGSYVYRTIIGDWNPNSGYSFAFPPEAYLNFGLPGTLAAGVALGWLFGFAWRLASGTPDRAAAVLYPLLVATLPLGFRSDALTHTKIVLYPMVAVAAAFAVARRRSGAVHQASPSPSGLRPLTPSPPTAN